MARRHFPFFVLFVLIYSVAVRFVLSPLLRVAAIFFDRIANQLEMRPKVEDLCLELSAKRRKHENSVVFFCSSAGEYEQARPLVDRFSAAGTFCHVFFFSRSGYDFAVKRHETVSFSLAPLDTVWNWSPLFGALQPDWIVVVRHEFWPAFLFEAMRWGQLVVVDAVPPAMLGRESELKTKFSAFGKRVMLGGVHHIFAADSGGYDYYTKYIGLECGRVTCVGDTKYDRVKERVASLKMASVAQAAKIRAAWGYAGDPVLVIGSAHVPDLELILLGLRDPVAPKFRLLVVPHDVSSRNIARIFDILRRSGRSVDLFSEIEGVISDGSRTDANALLVDSVGRLSELYAVGDLAWVGGAVHAKVHNVLEPAAWGLPMTCGTRFDNSQEARHFVGLGLIQPVADADGLVKAWHHQLAEIAKIRLQILGAVDQLAGASDMIFEKATTSWK